MIEVFISRFRDRTPSYQAWGEFVTGEIFSNLEVFEGERNSLFKIPAVPRIKKESSIRGKVERHSIKDLEREISDLVGVRFVVLLTSELELIENSIKKSNFFKWEKVRDYGIQADLNPELFEYQSIHYLVSPKTQFNHLGNLFSTDIICEVQIRTLLQHAYAELTHDNIYKPIHIVPPMARRLVARSMALMETTDELFCNTLVSLKSANRARNELLRGLKSLYRENVFDDPAYFDDRINLEIIDVFKDKIDLDSAYEKVLKLFGSRPAEFEFVKTHRTNMFLFSQPVILFLYALVDEMDYVVSHLWNFESMSKQLSIVFSRLGRAWENAE